MKVNIGKYHANDKQRTIKVQIDPWDTYNVDHTLALIILPLLKEYKLVKKGGSFVENEDVPHIAPIPKGQEMELSDEWEVRWNYVLGEMIHAFERIVDEEWEQDFHNGAEFDTKGYLLECERINNGLRLFGKYFRGLWT